MPLEESKSIYHPIQPLIMLSRPMVSPPQPRRFFPPRLLSAFIGAIKMAGWAYLYVGDNAMCLGARNICCQKILNVCKYNKYIRSMYHT